MLMRTDIRRAVQVALEEDMPWGDVTSEALIPSGLLARGTIVARAEGVLAGMDVAAEVFAAMEPPVSFVALATDGDAVMAGQPLARVEGEAKAILAGERVALNFLQRLSGVATLTRRYVEAVGGSSARIADTRKTTPGLRALEKYAVLVGGGVNHRQGLSDGILIKDNHLAALRLNGLDLAAAVATARARARHTVRVEVEVQSADDALRAVDAGADAVLLDNMPLEDMRRAVELVARGALVEASGNMTLDRVGAVAATGVDLISVGALTHSAPALDISLDLEVG